MQVHYDEGVAIHIDPKPCVGVREDGDEASVGESIGQPLSRESLDPGADAVSSAEGYTNRRAIASAWSTRRGREPGMCRHSLRGNREVSRSTVRQLPPVRIGKARSRSR